MNHEIGELMKINELRPVVYNNEHYNKSLMAVMVPLARLASVTSLVSLASVSLGSHQVDYLGSNFRKAHNRLTDLQIFLFHYSLLHFGSHLLFRPS